MEDKQKDIVKQKLVKFERLVAEAREYIIQVQKYNKEELERVKQLKENVNEYFELLRRDSKPERCPLCGSYAEIC